MGTITYGLEPCTPGASSRDRHFPVTLLFYSTAASQRRFYCHFLSKLLNHLLKVRVANAGQSPWLPDVTALGMITLHWGHFEALIVKWSNLSSSP